MQALYEGNSVPHLTQRQHALAQFAERLTRSPADFGPRDLARIRTVLPDEGDFVEAANVVAGFNFANRVADALDVPTEVPTALERWAPTRRLAMNVMSWAIRKRMNFADRGFDPGGGEEALRKLEKVLATHGVKRPVFFERLLVRPHILHGQAAITTTLLSTIRFSTATVVAVGYLTAELTGDVATREAYRRAMSAASVARCDRIARGGAGSDVRTTMTDRALAFARQVTVCADEVTDAQVGELRQLGFDDVDILDLVLLTAAGNATNRLSIALGTGEA